MRVGIDEVGCGAWCGPIYVVGFCQEATWVREGLKDSKELDKPMLYAIAKELQQHEHAVEIVTVEQIDSEGMKQGLVKAYRKIVRHFQTKYPKVETEIDGHQVPNGVRNVKAVPHGDTLVPHIQAAAIIAKFLRDSVMMEAAQQHPYYGWETNAGYGTPAHIEGLNAHGLTPLHRVSFKPVRKFLRDPPKPIGANLVTMELYSQWKTGYKPSE